MMKSRVLTLREFVAIEAASCVCVITFSTFIKYFPGVLLGTVWRDVILHGMRSRSVKMLSRCTLVVCLVLFANTAVVNLYVCDIILLLDRRISAYRIKSCQKSLCDTMRLYAMFNDFKGLIVRLRRIYDIRFWKAILMCFHKSHFIFRLRCDNTYVVYLKVFCRGSVQFLLLYALYDLYFNAWKWILFWLIIFDWIMCVEIKKKQMIADDIIR